MLFLKEEWNEFSMSIEGISSRWRLWMWTFILNGKQWIGLGVFSEANWMENEVDKKTKQKQVSVLPQRFLTMTWIKQVEQCDKTIVHLAITLNSLCYVLECEHKREMAEKWTGSDRLTGIHESLCACNQCLVYHFSPPCCLSYSVLVSYGY